MNIPKQDVALAKQAAEEKMKEFSVKIKPDDLDAYKQTLKNIAKNHSYAEGDNLSYDDSDILVEAVRKVVKGMENIFYYSPDDEKRKANVSGMIMAANDYMISLAMEELNSPVIHGYCTDQLKVIYHATASRCIDLKPRKGYITSDHVESQRGMKAEELTEYKVDSLLKAMKANPDDIDKGVELYVEYQALAKRQENHGAIWRLFHRKENDARTALLNEMKAAMAGKVSEADLSDLYAHPSTIIRKSDENETEKAIDEGLANREMNPEKGFDYLKYKKESNEPLPEPSEISKSTSLEENKIEIADNTNEIEQQPQEEIAVETAPAETTTVEIAPEEPKLEEVDTEQVINSFVDDLFSKAAAEVEDAKEPESVEKTKVYLPDLSETVGSEDKAAKIDEKTISAPRAEL